MNVVTQLLIGKYMAPELPTDEVTAAAPSEVLINSQSVIAQPTAISSNPKPDAKPTCPYCGKSLTHDRSRCPMIRAKDSTTIEQRIAELKQNTAEDTDNVGAHAIEVLENALLRKQGATVKKKASSNVSSDHDSRKNRYLFINFLPGCFLSSCKTCSSCQASLDSRQDIINHEDDPCCTPVILFSKFMQFSRRKRPSAKGKHNAKVSLT